MQAFEQLYRASVGRVHGLCLRMCGSACLAEELTQETFIRAWTKLDTFGGRSAFSTWLHRLAVNVVLGHSRVRSRREERERPLESTAGAEPAPSQRRPEEAVDLERAIAALPDGARKVFVLHDIEGYRHREIARLAGIAVGTSKAQLHRARSLLRDALRPAGPLHRPHRSHRSSGSQGPGSGGSHHDL
jgi:RNA polymerase sigma-70 factor (ECF subfamily)